ncbi:MAG: RNA polymerase sigma factor [Eubacteriales bacterium]
MTIENEDDRSFAETLYLDYFDKMYNLCYKQLHNHHDAEDAAMYALERIISNIQYFEEASPENLPGLIAICTKRAAIDYFKKMTYRNKHEKFACDCGSEEDEIDLTENLVDSSADVEQAVIDGEFVAQMKELIGRLPEEQSEVIFLRYSYQLRLAEIADLLGTSISTVNSRLMRARKRLKILIQQAK